MAQSLDGLIAVLLEEVALSGEKGFELSDIVASTRQFYQHSPVSAPSNGSSNSQSSIADIAHPALIDEHFITHLWKWLARHPDVLIGKEAQYNQSDLKELDKQYPGFISHSLDTKSPKSNGNAHEEPSEITRLGARTVNLSNRYDDLRIYVTKDRMFLAICGHPPDPTKVFASEWSLLSCIAAARHNGILQGELGRVTGQDKRSVPKRTDQLQQKGYVVKRTAYVKGTKTSRLFLQRFAFEQAQDAAVPDSWNPRGIEKLTVKYHANKMFEILKGNPLITQKSLTESLSMKTPGKMKVLSLMLKQFSRVGCVKRVKTAFGPSAQSGDLRLCIQYLREPTESDWMDDSAGGIDFDMSLDELAKPYDILHMSEPETALEDLEDVESDLEESIPHDRIVPVWNPDRILANVLLEASQKAGTEGMKNIDARRLITGPFVKRILESLLIKVSHQSLQSQPLGVKHLTVIRSKEANESILQYIHYTLDHFEQKVHSGKASWKDIDGATEIFTQLGLDAQASVKDWKYPKDVFGFPVRGQEKSLFRGGESFHSDLLRQAKIKDILISQGDEPSNGAYRTSIDLGSNDDYIAPVSMARKRGRPRKSVNNQNMTNADFNYKPERSEKEASTNHTGRGRPRKFLRGTEKYWRDMFVTAIRQADPDYVRTMGTTGVMQNPIGKQVFLARPDNFDGTLVRAMAAGLPIPGTPQEITDLWIHDTLAILDSSQDGLYFTQLGVQPRTRGKPSKFMVLKSKRLSEIDFTKREKAWDWQYLSSMASHSFRYKPYYARLDPAAKRSGFILRPPQLPRASRTPRISGPPRGTFYENAQLSAQRLVQSFDLESLPPATARRHNSRRSSSSTDTDPDLSQHIAQVEGTGLRNFPAENRHLLKHNTRYIEDNTTSSAEQLDSTQRTRPIRQRVQSWKAAEIAHGTTIMQHLASAASPEGDITTETSQLDLATDVSALQPTAASKSTLSLQSKRLSEENHSVEARTTANHASTISATPEIENEDHTTTSHTLGDTSLTAPAKVSQFSTGQLRPNAIVANLESESIDMTASVDNGTENLASNTIPRGSIPEQNGVSTLRGQKRTAAEDSSSESDVVRPVKRAKPITPNSRISRKQPARLCRNIIYDLIKLCSGLAPSDSWTFRRAMTARWIESGIDADPPTAKNVRTNLKALASGAKVKHITFAYRAKSGAMVTKSIIALRKFDSTSSEVLALQRKMAEADPEDYVPPEMVAEFDRAPSSILTQQHPVEVSDSENAISGELVTTPRARGKPRKSRNSARIDSGVIDHAQDIVLSQAHICFLTLKVPHLRSLDLPTQYSVQYRPPEASLQPETTRSLRSASGSPVPRRRGLRKNRGPRFDADTHNIVWINEKGPAFPSSLEDVPNIKLSRDEAALAGHANADLARFAAEVECVAQWETKDDIFNKDRCEENVFINHWPNSRQLLYVPVKKICFERQVEFDDSEEAQERLFPAERSWPPFVRALRSVARDSSMASAPRKKRKYTRRRRKSSSFVVDDDDDEDFTANIEDDNRATGEDDTQFDDGDHDESDEASPRKRRKTTTGRRKRGSERSSRRRTLDKYNSKRKMIKFRRPVQVVRYMPEDTQYRIVVSVIVVRTLAGGVEKFIDWNLVKRLIPKQEIEHIQVAWKSLLNRYRTDVNGLTDSLQDKYLDALMEKKVPSVNFANLNETDWEGILDWALASLEKFQTQEVDDLPPSRRIFYEQNSVVVEEPSGLRSTLGFGILTSQSRKDELLSGMIFGTKLLSSTFDIASMYHASTKVRDENLVRAKSWVFSLLVTPETTFDPKLAHTTLLKLAATPKKCEALVDRALVSLQRDKAISKGRETSKLTSSAHKQAVEVRTWQISSKYYEQFNFRRQITGSMLKVAAKYKLEVLDVAFSQNQPVSIGQDFTSDDGEMVAIINLMAMGAVSVRPGADLPDTRYGLDWENQGYSTRLIDKSTLGFTVILEPVPYAYEFGDPLDDFRSGCVIPRGEIDDSDSMGRIPPWYDIHLNLLPEMWNMYLGAVIGLVSIRPGADVQELSKSVANAIGEWEVGLIVQYLEEIGAIRKTRSGDGYETQIWWWMCLAAATDVDVDEDTVMTIGDIN